MYRRHITGKIGEEEAAKYLYELGYKIIEKNFQSKFGEIDIIAFDEKKKELVFIEVKTRTNNKYGSPKDAVDNKKIKHILKTAEYYLYKNRLLSKIFVRVDVIEVLAVGENYKINHIKQII